jgi:hypothetical protein
MSYTPQPQVLPQAHTGPQVQPGRRVGAGDVVLFDMSELLFGAGLMPGFMSITQRSPPYYTAVQGTLRRCDVKALIRDRYGSPDDRLYEGGFYQPRQGRCSC